MAHSPQLTARQESVQQSGLWPPDGTRSHAMDLSGDTPVCWGGGEQESCRGNSILPQPTQAMGGHSPGHSLLTPGLIPGRP